MKLGQKKEKTKKKKQQQEMQLFKYGEKNNSLHANSKHIMSWENKLLPFTKLSCTDTLKQISLVTTVQFLLV